MPQGRILLKSISLSKKMPQLSCDSARLLYTWALAHLDVQGVIYGDASVLNNLVFTRLNRTAATVEKYLIELESRGLIVRFEHESEAFIMYPDFIDKQPHLRPSHEGAPLVPVAITEQLRSNYRSGTAEIKVKSKLNTKCSKLANANYTTGGNAAAEKMYFCFESKKWYGVKPDDIERWQRTYPACDIAAELRKAADWLLANPTKRKQNYQRFFTNWLSRTQDKGGTKGTGMSSQQWAASKTKGE